MIRFSVLFVLLFSCFVSARSQSVFTLSGYVRDSSSDESISGATVLAVGKGQNVATNSYGFFSLSLSRGSYKIQISAPGLLTSEFELNLQGNTEQNFALSKQLTSMDVVDIRARKSDNVKRVDISTQTINAQTIKKIPAFLGEADVIKAVQLLPGVSTVGEGATGFNVRGGGIDQNLVPIAEALALLPGE